ncbi:MAG: cytochrome P450 [Myxococcales bacterium]|nr:cytochrome P450 [Myxococcales bacterium]
MATTTRQPTMRCDGQLRGIPRDDGPPIVGHALWAFWDLLAALRRIEAQGPVVWTRAVGIEILALLGADALEFGFRNRDDALSSQKDWAHFIDHVFPGAIMTMDGAKHRQHRRIMQAAFTSDSLRAYLAQMTPAIARGLDGWLGRRRRDRLFFAYPALKRLTLGIAAATFMGLDDPSQSTRLDRAFVDAVQASIAVLRLDLWPTTYWRGLRGREFLRQRFAEQLAAKRRTASDDLFSRLSRAESESGERFSDEEVVNHMIFLMMAAHDTSTSALTTILYLLAKHPRCQERLREQSGRFDRDELDADELNQLELHDRVLREALRLYPPLAVMPRMTQRATSFAGYLIPPGTLIGLAPLLVHHSPRLFSAPDEFDPDRFAPDRAEDQRHKYAWAPFGGGAHRCIGERFAAIEIKAVLHQLLRRYRWSVPSFYRMPYQLMPIARPLDGLPLQLRRL